MHISQPGKILLISLILITGVGCDQATKAAAKKNLYFRPAISYLHDTFRLQYAENSGAFLSLGSSLTPGQRFWIFTMITGIALAAVTLFIIFNKGLRPVHVAGFSLVIAGGTGNMIDRVLNNGAVIDFMNIGIGSLRSGIFNVADVAITAGALILVFFSSGLTGKSVHPEPADPD